MQQMWIISEIKKMIKEICIFLILAFHSWEDFRKKEIPLFSILLSGVTGSIWSFCEERTLVSYVMALGLGIAVLLLGICTREAIGLGDGLFLMGLGTWMPWEELLQLFAGGLFLCGICAGVLVAVRRGNNKMELPFIPFLLAGYLGGIFL